MSRGADSEFVGRAWTVAGIALLVIGLLALLWYAATFLLLFFAAILFAIFIRSLTNWPARHSFLSTGWAFVTVLGGLVGLLVLTGWLLAPEVIRQMERFVQELPRAIDSLEQRLRQYSWGETLLRNRPSFKELLSRFPAGGILSSTLGAVVQALVILFVGVYLAAAPQRYVDGAVALFPPGKRADAQRVFAVTGVTLERWLVGRVLLMISNGVVISVGLWLMGAPLPLALGVLSGLLNFVPNIGPIVAAVPAILLALMESSRTALYVVILYVAYQNVDGYILTPLVQQRTVDLPPALTIMAQVLMGILTGVLGVLLAVPIVATAMVWTKILYLNSTLGEDISLPRGAEDHEKSSAG